jgi:plastocyanin
MTTNTRTARFIALTCAAALALCGLAACGDDDDTSGGGGGGGGVETTETREGGATTTLQETAVERGGLAFSEPELTAPAGTVTITLSNPSENQQPHALEVEGNGVEEETETLQPGSGGSVTVELAPGTYELYCPVGNHREQGMEGTLTVG